MNCGTESDNVTHCYSGYFLLSQTICLSRLSNRSFFEQWAEPLVQLSLKNTHCSFNPHGAV